MKVMLASSIYGLNIVNGIRVPSVLIQQNNLLGSLKSIWKQNANVLIICAEPDNYDKNDSLYYCLKESFPMSGLSISGIEICDGRNLEAIDKLENIDVLVLAGGHVPTQNKFMKQLCLKERLRSYDGIVVAWSAGSMNCANTVYAGPELEGEAIDPMYERWITGLGLTDVNIFPHFQSLRDGYLDGLRIVEDITFDDSYIHEIIALNDGSYIMIDEGIHTLYGEAYMIKDGKQWQICKDGEMLVL
ncbi:MAG: Type 1 glutamine amidotransferase-like domain-containing protein [Clostridia bacterium]|nr:Type 1 glutamine amidotransferase-like domain-containing protein [Clostridia bacterium]